MLLKLLLVVSTLLLPIAALAIPTGSSKPEQDLPIVTGNFSVSWIQHSPVGAFPDPAFNGEPVPPPENWAMHHAAGIKAYEDYVAWGAVEREPGKWDWSRQIEVADKQRAGGLEYDPYLWLMNPPLWMRTGDWSSQSEIQNPKSKIAGMPDHFTMMKCLEHGEETYTFSIWDPATLVWFERFYREMHRALGDKIGRTYVGLVGPYGEGNYPLPVPDWVKIGHTHEGYWCGDPYALKAFQRAMTKRHRTLRALNDAWGTEFGDLEHVGFPPEIREGKLLKAQDRIDPKARRRWVDFVEWYHQTLIDFSVDVTRAANKYFPVEKLKMKPGGSAGGVNPIAWGTYCPGYARALGEFKVQGSRFKAGEREFKVRLQPADCHGRPFGDRWYGTAYRFYGIPFTTEPAGGLDQRSFLRRVFMDASNGATEMFSYEWDKHKTDGLKWIHLYRGVPSITDVAVYCPTTWYRMNGDIWPAINAADSLRDVTDFEVADELLIEDDYLTKSKTRVLIWLMGPVVERKVLERIVDWVEDGGMLVAGMPRPPMDVEGRDDLGVRLFAAAETTSGAIGKGLVIRYPSEPKPGDEAFRELVCKAVYHPEQLSPGLKGAPEVDGKPDGVWTAVFPDMLLLYNATDKPVDVERTWNGRTTKRHLEPGELAEDGERA